MSAAAVHEPALARDGDAVRVYRTRRDLRPTKKVTEKVDKLTVFGGLEGVLKDVVRIQVPAG